MLCVSNILGILIDPATKIKLGRMTPKLIQIHPLNLLTHSEDDMIFSKKKKFMF